MNKTKMRIVFFSKGVRNRAMSGVSDFRERMSDFSLDFPPFGPSVLDGARSKVGLRDEGYVRTSICGVRTTLRGRDLFLLGLFFS